MSGGLSRPDRASRRGESVLIPPYFARSRCSRSRNVPCTPSSAHYTYAPSAAYAAAVGSPLPMQQTPSVVRFATLPVLVACAPTYLLSLPSRDPLRVGDASVVLDVAIHGRVDVLIRQRGR